MKDKINDLTNRLVDALPSGAKEASSSIKQTVKDILQTGLGKMEMVSREEFDVQAKILARTREKLQVLEQQVAELERQSSDK